MPTDSKKYQLVTRSDMDGLVCAVLLRQKGLIDEIIFVHPKDVQDGKIEISENHITTNLPYSENAHLVFDHHYSETLRIHGSKKNHVIDPYAPSTSRVVYDYFGGKKAFPDLPDEMMIAVDKADAAHFTMEDVVNPQGWELLSFIMDARTGLGRFKDFRISNYNLMMNLIDYCQSHPISEILQLPDVKERVDLYFYHQDRFKEQLKRCSVIYGNLVVLDLLNEDTIYPGNRFMIYVLFQDCSVSMYIMWGFKKQNTVFAVGKSIFNRTAKFNIGELMLKYGGGGHSGAGTCQIDNNQADQIRQDLIDEIVRSA